MKQITFILAAAALLCTAPLFGQNSGKQNSSKDADNGVELVPTPPVPPVPPLPPDPPDPNVVIRELNEKLESSLPNSQNSAQQREKAKELDRQVRELQQQLRQQVRELKKTKFSSSADSVEVAKSIAG